MMKMICHWNMTGNVTKKCITCEMQELCEKLEEEKE